MLEFTDIDPSHLIDLSPAVICPETVTEREHEYEDARGYRARADQILHKLRYMKYEIT
jgi:hypothetical protein